MAAEALGGGPRFLAALLVLGLAVLIAVPPLLPKYFLDVLISVLFTAYLGASWNILGGYAGQFSFGHAAFFGIGAYTSTLLLLRVGLTPWVGMLAGGVLAAAFGLLAGYLSFRYGLKGPYFSLVTLAFAEMLRVVAVNTKAVGSSLGLVVPSAQPAPGMFIFAGKLPYYYVILAMALAAMALTLAIERARLGYCAGRGARERGCRRGGGRRRPRHEAPRHGHLVVPHRARRHLLRAVLRVHRPHHHVRAGRVDPGPPAGDRGRRGHRARAVPRLLRADAGVRADARGAARPRRAPTSCSTGSSSCS